MGRLKAAIAGIAIAIIGLAVVIFLTKDNIPQDTDGMAVHGDAVEVVKPLEKNQQEEILHLIQDYYTKFTSNDVDGYQNIDVYIKDGAKSNEHIVFSYYEMKIKNTNTPIPGIGTHYVMQNPDGTWQIIDEYQNCEIQEAIVAEVSDEDIQQLLKEVQQKYTKAIESDVILKKTIEELQSDRL